MTHPTHSSALNVARRQRELDELLDAEHSPPIDLLVIGGGVTGCGVALDAASRGLSVVLVEAHDLAFGTSRWSSKLVHGGLRYLASGDFAVAHESARERHILMTTVAPHVTHPLQQLLPYVAAVSSKQRIVSRIGLALGDGLRRFARTPSALLPAPRHVTRKQALALFPALTGKGLEGGVVSTDGQLVDDAKLVTLIARTAAAYGARILTRVRASDVTGAGATLHDTLEDRTFTVRARAVINATGVWAGHIDSSITMRPSRGTHLVLDAARFGHPTAALTVPHPGSTSRFVFALPQPLDRVIVGITDEDTKGEIADVPQATESEIDFLLHTLSRALETPLTRADVRGTFSGLRPLVHAEGVTADISRRHHIEVSPAGLVNVLGGKLTTYRAMAQQAVDVACAHAGIACDASTTATLPLIGAPASPVKLTNHDEHSPCENPIDQIAIGIDLTRADVARAVLVEGALHADDVLDRRTRIGLVPEDRDRAKAAVEQLVTETLARLTRKEG